MRRVLGYAGWTSGWTSSRGIQQHGTVQNGFQVAKWLSSNMCSRHKPRQYKPAFEGDQVKDGNWVVEVHWRQKFGLALAQVCTYFGWIPPENKWLDRTFCLEYRKLVCFAGLANKVQFFTWWSFCIWLAKQTTVRGESSVRLHWNALCAYTCLSRVLVRFPYLWQTRSALWSIHSTCALNFLQLSSSG